MASTSSPRKTPSARARAAARPVTPDVVESAETPATDTQAAPAPAPARKRAPRKTAAKTTGKTTAAPSVTAVEAMEPVAEPAVVPEVVAAPIEVPPEAPAKKTPRRPARKKAAAPVVQVEAEAEAETATSVPDITPAPVPVPDTAAEPEVVPEPAQPPAPEPAPEPAVEPAPEPEPIPEPVAEQAPPPDLRPDHSAVTLERSVRHRLHWAAGRRCPPELDAIGQALDTTTDAAPLANDLALIELVRLARERRHTLQVSEEVWDWLAQARDMRARVEHLERTHPAGPLSPTLAALVTAPLRPYQSEAALYAACAGRSLLADDAGLGKTVQAIAALRLIGQGFGAEQALVLCPPERVEHWQAQWSQWVGADAAFTPVFASLATLAEDIDRLRALDADVVVVDEPVNADDAPWAHPDHVALLQTLASPWALVIARSPLDSRPDAWRAMLDWIDTGHFGAVTAFTAGQGGDLDLDTLAPWMLRRTKTMVLRQLPETVELTLLVALSPDQRTAHDAGLAQLRRRVQRWQRSQFLGSTEQRQLFQALHSLRQCGHDQKVAAALSAIDAALQTPDAKVVVFSQWSAHLEALGAALQSRGSAFRHLTPEVFGDARRALVSEFQQEADLRVLLCSDDERGGSLGLRHAATAVVHLDRPWNPALLMQRLSRVHRTDRVRLVPVHHLVVQDSVESRLVQAQQSETAREHFVGLVDGPHADVFLDGPRLTRFMSALQALVDDPASAPDAGLNPG